MIIAFYKPFNVLSQFTGEKPEETLSVFGLPKNVYACGRLDKDSEGLLILSDEANVQHRLTDPKFEKEKIYWVQVEGVLATIAYSAIVTFIILKVIDLIIGIRVEADDERMGLDLSQHGERIE